MESFLKFFSYIDSEKTYTQISPLELEIAKISSISAGPDNGANGLMTQAFTDPMRHRSTEELVNNINNRRIALKIDKIPSQIQTAELPFSSLRATELFIGGHGNEGSFETGAGNTASDPAAEVYGNNFQAFTTLQKLKTRNTKLISIYSCYTGAGYDGASLLYTLAKLLNVTVRARTGLTTCHSRPVNNSLISFQIGSTWQIATPDMIRIPTPIEKPTSNLKSLLQPNLEEIGISIKTIKSIEIILFDKGNIINKSINDSEQIKYMFSLIFDSDFFYNDGIIMGKKTINLQLHFINGSKPTEINVYCNTIAQINGSDISFLVNEDIFAYLLSI